MQCLMLVIPLLILFPFLFIGGITFGFKSPWTGNKRLVKFLLISFILTLIAILGFFLLANGCTEFSLEGLSEAKIPFILLFFVTWIGMYLGSLSKNLFRK